MIRHGIIDAGIAPARRAFAMNELSWLEVNLSRLEANLAWWRALVNRGGAEAAGGKVTGAGVSEENKWGGGVKVCGVVKANGYGMGAVAVAQRLVQSGVDMLAVYSVAQAEELVEAGIRKPILTLMPTRELEQTEAVAEGVREGRLHLAVNDPGQLEMIGQLGRRLGCRVPVHFHVDTGMSRSGLSVEEFGRCMGMLEKVGSVKLAGVFSHLATAHTDGAMDEEQLRRFDDVVGAYPQAMQSGVVHHLAATAGACRGKRFLKGMVRIGLGLYGYGPELMQGGPGLERENGLVPVVRWLGRIVHLQKYPRGATVGYGCTHRLERESVLGVVPVGYGEGYPLSASNAGVVRVMSKAMPGKEVKVVGRVSMDQIVLDVTDVVDVERGMMVELLSAERTSGCSLSAMAMLAGTSEYEVLCRISPRLPRCYVNVEQVEVPGLQTLRRMKVQG